MPCLTISMLRLRFDAAPISQWNSDTRMLLKSALSSPGTHFRLEVPDLGERSPGGSGLSGCGRLNSAGEFTTTETSGARNVAIMPMAIMTQMTPKKTANHRKRKAVILLPRRR